LTGKRHLKADTDIRISAGTTRNKSLLMLTNVIDAQSKNKFDTTPTLSPCSRYLYIY
tara:strand:- start:534 stop:704 length:171 start_codon:yes stop_codon:yes gene_type:complete